MGDVLVYFRGTEMVLKGGVEILEKLLKTWDVHQKALGEASMLKELGAYSQQNGDMSVNFFESVNYKAVASALSNKNISYAIVQDKDTGLLGIVTKGCDKEKVANIVSGIEASERKHSFLNEKAFALYASGQNVITINGVSQEQLKLIHEYVEQNQQKKHGDSVAFTSSKQEDGRYAVSFQERNKDMFYAATSYAACQTAIDYNADGNVRVGIVGKLNTARVSEELNVLEAAVTGANSGPELYVVNPANPDDFIHITQGKAQHIRNGKVVGEAVGTLDSFNADVYGQVLSIPNAITVTPAEFIDKEHLSKTIQSKLHTFQLNGSEYRFRQIEAAVQELFCDKQLLGTQAQRGDVYTALNSGKAFTDVFLTESSKERAQDIAHQLDNLSDTQKQYAIDCVGLYCKEMNVMHENTHIEQMSRTPDLDTMLESIKSEVTQGVDELELSISND